MKFKRFTKITIWLILLLTLSLVIGPNAKAAVYGGQNYGDCKYGQNCSSASSSSGGSQSTDQPESTSGEIILLNDFPEYSNDQGKEIELKAKQTVYFDVITNGKSERISLTVKTVGDDFVVFTISSLFDEYNLHIGDSKQFDVNNDGVYDIEVTLTGIVKGVASFNFKALSKLPAAATISQPQETKKSFPWILVLSFTALLIGLVTMIVLIMKRRKNNQKPIQF